MLIEFYSIGRCIWFYGHWIFSLKASLTTLQNDNVIVWGKMTDRPLHSHIKNPVILTISDGKTEFHSGCRVIDINFPNISNPEV